VCCLMDGRANVRINCTIIGLKILTVNKFYLLKLMNGTWMVLSFVGRPFFVSRPRVFFQFFPLILFAAHFVHVCVLCKKDLLGFITNIAGQFVSKMRWFCTNILLESL